MHDHSISIFVLSLLSSLYSLYVYISFFFLCVKESAELQLGRSANYQTTSNGDDNKKTQTSNTGTEKQQRGTNKHLKSRDSSVHGWGGGGGFGDGVGWGMTVADGWRQLSSTARVAPWSHSGGARYVTEPKHATRSVCVCVCAYDMKRWLTALWDQELRTL